VAGDDILEPLAVAVCQVAAAARRAEPCRCAADDRPGPCSSILALTLLAPACVVAVSVAGRRWGTPVAGALGGLPVVARPILLVLTLTHGTAFGATASRFCLARVIGLTAFSLVYARAARLTGLPATVLAGWAAFLVCMNVFISPTRHQPRRSRSSSLRRRWTDSSSEVGVRGRNHVRPGRVGATDLILLELHHEVDQPLPPPAPWP
jgi:hypothetical protein